MPRRILEGNVVSAKTDKTITVKVERRFMHPMYKKYIKSSSKYNAHDETNAYKEGDRVSIIECRPISKTKSWTVYTGDETSAPKKAEKPAAKKTEPKAKAAPKSKDEAKPAAAKKAPAKKADAKKPAAKKAKATKKDAK